MNRTWLLVLICALVISHNVNSQDFHLQGVVIDSISQETLEGVAVQAISTNAKGKDFFAVTNVNGKFLFNLPADSYTINLSIIGYAPAQQTVNVARNSKLTFTLTPQPIPLGEVVVSSFRINRTIKQLPTPLAVVGKQDFQQQSAISLSNVLSNEPGIAMGSDGVWATNINIRGLGENRLVTLVDGFRVETATDLTASLSMVDLNDVERVEVVKGAQSALYGTGAMGGIINIITKDGYFSSEPHLSGNIIAGYTSANSGYSGYANINTGADRWYLKVNGTYSDAQNIKTPEGEIPNSQFRSNNIAARAGFKPFKNHTLRAQYQRYWANDVGIPGGSTFPGPATATYTDIGRQLFSASYEITDITSTFSSLKLSYFNQYILRDVLLYPNTVTESPTPTGGIQKVSPQYFTPTGEHQTNGLQLQGRWDFYENNTFIAGIDAWARELYTEREKYITVEVFNPAGDLMVTNNLVRGETPTPKSTFGTAGIFVQDESRLLDDKLTLIIGGRADGIQTENEENFDIDYLIVNGERNDSPPNQRVTFEAGKQNLFSWSANAGLLYRVLKEIDLSASFARSFRAPSLEESFKFIDLGNLVLLGDPTLKSESGYATDLGVRIWKQNFTMQVDIFANWINNMIVETPGEYIYTTTTGPLAGTTDTLPALVNANVSSAMLYGTDIKFQYKATKGLVIFGSGAYVRGKDTEADENLPQIPPLRGQFGLRYNIDKIGTIETTIMGASKQDKIAEGETATDGYHRIDLRVSSTKFNLGFSNIQLFAGIDNLTNVSYTNHLATNRGAISIEPGRNIYLRANISF
ncbi:MAG: TonB-dependent receptor [Dysgonamonadaceae bacterium]|nr:TonB-dependent receptor [Dysgonamonadaceae bacterium]MDD3355487.1 TonB-dependent receptor [Dysgonamonadaceae bacterium]MDD3727598.1 TonB-dependent receptor [Dysgonamonadaceae bacterium]MDD4246624.1 TonB-dependent receptor [Dysgonamonadaceae bacterium]MDD4605883.1 TonB-dependent receptor [Dysgonamonadaceae bacterium]